MKLKVSERPKNPEDCIFSDIHYVGEIPNNYEPLFYSEHPYKEIHICRISGQCCENTVECLFLEPSKDCVGHV